MLEFRHTNTFSLDALYYGPAAWIRTTITSLEWKFEVADCILFRITFFKCPNQLDDSGKTLVPYPRFERGELLLLREMTLPICPVGHLLVPRYRIELSSTVCNTVVLPLNYRGINLGCHTSIDLVLPLSQSRVQATTLMTP